VGHSGVLPAAVQAVETVDRCLERVLQSAERRGATLLITADHGNCELMIDPTTDGPHTAHTTNPVPFLIVGDDAPARLRHGGVTLLAFGYLGGSRGSVGVGMSNGPTGGLRYETALGGAIGVSFGLAYAQTTRFVVNPYKDTLSRKSGPYDNAVVLADAGLQLVLTGKKTWR